MELIETKPEEKLEEAFTEDFPNTWWKNAEEKPTEEDHLDRWKYAVPTLPTHWYIETEEMKKSEYWEVFKEWYIKATNDDTYKWTSEMYGKSETSDFNWKLQYVEDGCKKLSPQQWYDTIYDGDRVVIAEWKLKSTEEDDWLLFGNWNKKWKTIFRWNEWTVFMEVDHDKAMEIPEVPEFEFPEFWAKRIDYDCAMWDQLRLITNSLNAVIKKINNL